MSTKIQEWHKNKATLPDVIADLKKMLEDKCWNSFFTHDESDNGVIYTSSKKYMLETVRLSHCGYASSVFSESLALQLINDALNENVEHIARWLLFSSDSSMSVMIFGDGPLGMVVFDDRSTTEVQYVLMCLRKCEAPCHNSSGFFVEFLIPVPNL